MRTVALLLVGTKRRLSVLWRQGSATPAEFRTVVAERHHLRARVAVDERPISWVEPPEPVVDVLDHCVPIGAGEVDELGGVFIHPALDNDQVRGLVLLVSEPERDHLARRLLLHPAEHDDFVTVGAQAVSGNAAAVPASTAREWLAVVFPRGLVRPFRSEICDLHGLSSSSCLNRSPYRGGDIRSAVDGSPVAWTVVSLRRGSRKLLASSCKRDVEID